MVGPAGQWYGVSVGVVKHGDHAGGRGPSVGDPERGGKGLGTGRLPGRT